MMLPSGGPPRPPSAVETQGEEAEMGSSDTPPHGGEGQEAEQSSHEWTERLRVTEYFKARLAEEVRRAERYGRRFAVVYVNCGDVGARRVFNNVRPRMRCTDIVEVIRSQAAPDGDAGTKPGAMPNITNHC